MNVQTPNIAIGTMSFLEKSQTFVADILTHAHRFNSHYICRYPSTECPITSYKGYSLGSSHRTSLASVEFLRLTSRHFGLERYLKNNQINCMHANFLYFAADIVDLAKRVGIPLIVTAHGYDATETVEHVCKTRSGRYMLSKTQAIAEYATQLVVPSKFIADCLLRRGYPAKKIQVIPCGVDTNQLVSKYPSSERTGVLYVGRLVEKKGVKFLLKAWQAYQHLIPDHDLYIVGGGKLAPFVNQFANVPEHRTHYLGPLDRADVYKFMQRCKVFCLPSTQSSTGDNEGNPVAVMEAKSFGLPTVTFAQGPMLEVIENDFNGLLATDRDANDLGLKLVELCTNRDLWRACSENSRQDAVSNYGLRKYIDSLESIYFNAIASS